MRLDRRRLFLTLGNGWVVEHCYRPAIARLGGSLTDAIDIASDDAIGPGISRARELLEAAPETLLIVATPNRTHWPIARALAAPARRILVEKPIALPGELSAHTARGAAARGIFVSTPYRFRPDVALLAAWLKAGVVGEVRRVRIAWRRRAGIPRPGSWYTNAALAGGGVLIDLGPHVIDVGLALMGWPNIRVASASLWGGVDWDRCASDWMPAEEQTGLARDVETGARLGMIDGAGRELEVQVDWASDAAEDETVVDIDGSVGALRLRTLFGFAPGRARSAFTGMRKAELPLERDPATDFARMLQALDGESAASAEQGARVMAVIDQAYRLARADSAGAGLGDPRRIG
jgi:predicted dehydrogenase